MRDCTDQRAGSSLLYAARACEAKAGDARGAKTAVVSCTRQALTQMFALVPILQSADSSAEPVAAPTTRRDTLRLLAASAAALAVPPGSDAAGVDLGLRRSGRSKKFDVPLEKYKKLPSGLLYYDVVARDPRVLVRRDGYGADVKRLHSAAAASPSSLALGLR